MKNVKPYLLSSLCFIAVFSSYSAQPYLVKDTNPGSQSSSIYYLTAYNNLLLFANTDTTHGLELWKSDGTATGTLMIKDINPGAQGSMASQICYWNGDVFFFADDSINGRELWKSNGTASGTLLVKDINPGSADSLDGYIPEMVVDKNGVYFPASDKGGYIGLWKSDGTESGTLLLKNYRTITPPGLFTRSNENLFFAAEDLAHGSELWLSDGTPKGTRLVKDINPGFGGSHIQYPAAMNGALFFFANEYQLWKSDGTDTGTIKICQLPPTGHVPRYPGPIKVVNRALYFAVYNWYDIGYELWKSDGTESGSGLLKDIYPGYLNSSLPSNLTDVNGTLFFSATDGIHGRELWKSDGTATGTIMVCDIFMGVNNSSPDILLNVNGRLFFQAKNEFGLELCTSDGTESGTLILADINPYGNSIPDFFTKAGNLLYFVANDGVHGKELWALNLAELPSLNPTIYILY